MAKWGNIRVDLFRTMLDSKIFQRTLPQIQIGWSRLPSSWSKLLLIVKQRQIHIRFLNSNRKILGILNKLLCPKFQNYKFGSSLLNIYEKWHQNLCNKFLLHPSLWFSHWNSKLIPKVKIYFHILNSSQIYSLAHPLPKLKADSHHFQSKRSKFQNSSCLKIKVHKSLLLKCYKQS